MSYYIRERIKGSSWDFIALTSGGAMSSHGEPFPTKSDAMAAWSALDNRTKKKHSRAHIVGPRGGCYRVGSGRRMAGKYLEYDD